MKKGLLIVGLSLLYCVGFADRGAWDCDPNSETYYICGHMVHLKSHVKLLDAQRDLIQVNYPFLESLGSGASQVVERLFKMSEEKGAHLESLLLVKEQADSLAQQAHEQSPEALVTANQIRKQCLNCHAAENPSSGREWKEITKNGWEHILARCNDVNTPRNPYACKSMFGLLSVVELFESAEIGKSQDFATVQFAAEEIVRISSDLISKGMLHDASTGGGNLYLVRQQGQEIKEAAERKDPMVFEQVKNVVQSCQTCHFVLR